jgi:hypothetical protein
MFSVDLTTRDLVAVLVDDFSCMPARKMQPPTP